MLDPCPDCPARFRTSHGPTHPYIGANAGCWALYSELLAGTPSDETLADSVVDEVELAAAPQVVRGTRALLADAYAAQHHGVPSPQAIQSVAVHLLVLHGVFVHGVAVEHAQWVRTRSLRRRGVYTWLEPPPRHHALSIRHLFAGDGVDRARTMDEYVASVYSSWAAQHREQLARWYEAQITADHV